MGFAIVNKENTGRGKRSVYVVKQNGQKVATFEDNGKLGVGSARDLAQQEARRRNSNR